MYILKRIYSIKNVFIVLSSCGIIILLLAIRKIEPQNANRNHPTNSQSNRNGSGFVTVSKFQGRLGNQMFEFAALFYVAQQTNREVVLFNDHNAHELEKYFSISVRKIKRSCPCFLFEGKLSSYDFHIDESIRSLDATNSQTILLFGFFQSWKYLEPVKNLVLNQMKFRKSIEVFARDILRETIPEGWIEGRFVRVGIHNRRGDLLSKHNALSGKATAPESYFKKAMKYFTDRYKLIQFIVVSDDIKWSREHITNDSQSSSVKVIFSEKHSPGQDMAILSLCDHVIISSGTFGWMSAWLANGTTVYYSRFPVNGSAFAKRLNRLDYYPSHWISME